MREFHLQRLGRTQWQGQQVPLQGDVRTPVRRPSLRFVAFYVISILNLIITMIMITFSKSLAL